MSNAANGQITVHLSDLTIGKLPLFGHKINLGEFFHIEHIGSTQMGIKTRRAGHQFIIWEGNIYRTSARFGIERKFAIKRIETTSMDCGTEMINGKASTGISGSKT